MAGKSVVLTGARGYLGRYLHAELVRRGLEVATLGRGDDALRADLGDEAAIAALAPRLEGALVLHAAALASIAECASAPGRAGAVNARAVAALARGGPARLLLVSTDLVF